MEALNQCPSFCADICVSSYKVWLPCPILDDHNKQSMEEVNVCLKHTPLADAINVAFSKVLIQESTFYTLFPKFKISYPVYRWITEIAKVPVPSLEHPLVPSLGNPLAPSLCHLLVPQRGHYEIKIPFTWSQYGIPRFGILAFTAKPSIYTKWEVVFSPWNSEGDHGFKNINWMHLYYIDYFSPIYVLETILWEAFQTEDSPIPPTSTSQGQAKVNDNLENQ